MSSSTSDGTLVSGFRRLFEPIAIGNFTVRNRIVNKTHGSRVSEARDLRYLHHQSPRSPGLNNVSGIYS